MKSAKNCLYLLRIFNMIKSFSGAYLNCVTFSHGELPSIRMRDFKTILLRVKTQLVKNFKIFFLTRLKLEMYHGE